MALTDVQSLREALEAGMGHHDAGRLDLAEASCRAILRTWPGHPDALALLAEVAQRTGRPDEAESALREALRQRPDDAELHHKLGLVLAARGALDGAAAALRRALRLRADFADAAFHLGNVLWRQRRSDEAIAAYRRATSLRRGFAAAHNNLALILQGQGRWEDALGEFRAALAAEDSVVIGANAARCVEAMPRVPADAETRALVARAIAQAWARPAQLARVAIGLLRMHPAIGPAIEAAARGDAPALSREVADACVREPLFAALLENAHASDRALELFLAAARRALLDAWLSGGVALAHALPFACILARQCFLNDYVFALREGEGEAAARLEQEIASAIAADTPPAPVLLALLGCYVPLARLPAASKLLDRAWPKPLRDLLTQQVAEPALEAELAKGIPSLTPVARGVSEDVRRQYEESPYPRWTRVPEPGPHSLDAYLRALFPHVRWPAQRIADAEILVAGCGTGQESLDLARQYPASRILALDLSRASLGYAARKSAEAGCRNVEHAQADITQLALGREFDLISCVGVLHHLADPLVGWRTLARHLRPGGFMQVGLYSALARRDITAARAMIAERGYAPVPADIRSCREELLAPGASHALERLRDMYGMNECRDLLFHVQEHCTTLPQVRDTLDAVGLRFVGMALPPAMAQAFAQRFPGEAAADLGAWEAFEREHPQTFAGMYIFWVQRPAAG